MNTDNQPFLSGQLVTALRSLDDCLTSRIKKKDIIEADFPAEKLAANDRTLRRERLDRAKADFEAEWTTILRTMVEIAKKIRKVQPRLQDMKGSEPASLKSFPRELVIGKMRISYENYSDKIPRITPFPYPSAVWFPAAVDSKQHINSLLLRLILSLPIDSLKITGIDPLQLGNSFNMFLPLLDHPALFPEKKILTRQDEIENSLNRIVTEIENYGQNLFKGQFRNWDEFNKQNNNSLPYRVLVIYDVPEQISDRGLYAIGRIIEHGPKCGVLPVVTIDESKMQNNQQKTFLELVKKQARRIDILSSSSSSKLNCLQLSPKPESLPDPASLSGLINEISKQYRNASETPRTLEQLLQNFPLWEGNSSAGISAPIGWAAGNSITYFTLGRADSQHHALIGGKTGSGKSNLLHVMINSLCRIYSPDELRLYLLDYKQATEFNVYASPPLPHAKLVATVEDVSYGISVLEHLEQEMVRRAEKFKSIDTNDFHDYRDRTHDRIPRVLLIIDEFQVLFAKENGVSERAETLLSKLLKQGRAFGIHIILSTQTIRMLFQLSPSASQTSQIGCRLALSCTPEDSRSILGSNNEEAASLKSPPEGIINNQNGEKSANQRFIIPKAEPAVYKPYLELFTSKMGGKPSDTKIFNGNELPVMPGNIGPISPPRISFPLGEEMNFTAAPFYLDFKKELGANVLIAGKDPLVKEAILSLLLLHSSQSSAFDEVIYYNPRTGNEGNINWGSFRNSHKLTVRSAEWECDFASIANRLQERRHLIIIDGFEYANKLHPLTHSTSKQTPEAAQSAAFKIILENGPTIGTFVVVFADDWARCNTLLKDVQSSFLQKVCLFMNHEDSSSFLFGNSYSKYSRLQKNSSAVYYNRSNDAAISFRPYKQQGDDIW